MQIQIVIPMYGYGERFRRAGYEVPKPLIEVEGKPIIAHVIELFPGEVDFSFICSNEHLANPHYKMREILKRYCPSGKIYGIDPHKLGPVYAVQKIQKFLDPDSPVIVNYCDFTCYWNWAHFKQFVRSTQCVGAIPAYKGFHPHSLGSTNYAYVKEADGWISDIQEKMPFTANKMDEYASSGTYDFDSARTMLEEFDEMVEGKLELNGEYYVSLAYKRLCRKSQKVAVYPLQHFMQWGTPEDLREYNYWSKTFKNLGLAAPSAVVDNGATIIPMAGLGQRFASEGYLTTKPLIPVSGRTMVAQATDDLPQTPVKVFVVRADMPDYDRVVTDLIGNYPEAEITTLEKVTDGQARTAALGVDQLECLGFGSSSPVTIGVCDTGIIYSAERYAQLLDDPSIDVIVWGIREYANAIRYPTMYGWIESNEGVISKISVKQPLKDPDNDPIIIGIFTFKNKDHFTLATRRLFERNGRVNGEFYLDSCIEDAIELGLKCVVFEVDSYLCWGTPNELKTFEYWQSCFHLWRGHPYSLENDGRIPQLAVKPLEEKFKKQNPVPSLSPEV